MPACVTPTARLQGTVWPVQVKALAERFDSERGKLGGGGFGVHLRQADHELGAHKPGPWNGGEHLLEARAASTEQDGRRAQDRGSR